MQLPLLLGYFLTCSFFYILVPLLQGTRNQLISFVRDARSVCCSGLGVCICAAGVLNRERVRVMCTVCAVQQTRDKQSTCGVFANQQKRFFWLRI